MKKLARIFFFAVSLFFVGCSSAFVDTPATEDTLRSTTFGGRTTYWAEEIPLEMEFETGAITLNDYYVGETDTGVGYSTTVQIEFIYPDEMDEKERYWFLKDDFTAYLYVENEDNDIEESYLLNISDYNDIGVEVQSIGSSVYFNCAVQREGRYSVNGSNIQLILNYNTDNQDVEYSYDAIIDESHMAKFDKENNCTFVGDSAAAFIARKSQIITDNETP